MEIRPLFITYYTPRGIYEAAARALEVNIRSFGLDFHGEAIPRPGKNTPAESVHGQRRKARYIIDCMNRFPGRHLIWIDADMGVLKYPSFLVDLCSQDVDISFRKHFTNEQPSTTVFFWGNTLKAENIARAWADECDRITDREMRISKKEMGSSDEPILAKILQDTKDELKKIDLPVEYNFSSKHWHRYPDVDPVICEYGFHRAVLYALQNKEHDLDW